MQVILLTLTLMCGLVSLATVVSEPASHLLAVESGWAGNSYLFILAAETCFPELLEPIKQHLKIIKIRIIRLWTFSI
jgi:hypothetical protein